MSAQPSARPFAARPSFSTSTRDLPLSGSRPARNRTPSGLRSPRATATEAYYDGVCRLRPKPSAHGRTLSVCASASLSLDRSTCSCAASSLSSRRQSEARTRRPSGQACRFRDCAGGRACGPASPISAAAPTLPQLARRSGITKLRLGISRARWVARSRTRTIGMRASVRVPMARRIFRSSRGQSSSARSGFDVRWRT
jgi:hypothetical protein